MLNINELEKKWLTYKIKSYIPYVVISISAIIIVLIIVSIYSVEDDSVVVVIEKKSTKTTLTKNTKPVETIVQKNEYIDTTDKSINKPYQQEKPNIIDEQDNKLVLSPSLDFMRNMNSNSPRYYEEEKEIKEDKPYQEDVVYKNEKKEQQVIEVEEIETEVVDNHNVNIRRQNTQDDIQHVLTRFKESNNPTLSLFIAKKYFELENYNQAYNYSLITNGINNNIEESWIIFAKSLVKLDKKAKAIEVLKKYINHSHSNRAKILLDDIKSGKMK